MVGRAPIQLSVEKATAYDELHLLEVKPRLSERGTSMTATLPRDFRFSMPTTSTARKTTAHTWSPQVQAVPREQPVTLMATLATEDHPAAVVTATGAPSSAVTRGGADRASPSPSVVDRPSPSGADRAAAGTSPSSADRAARSTALHRAASAGVRPATSPATSPAPAAAAAAGGDAAAAGGDAAAVLAPADPEASMVRLPMDQIVAPPPPPPPPGIPH